VADRLGQISDKQEAPFAGWSPDERQLFFGSEDGAFQPPLRRNWLQGFFVQQ